MIWIYLIGSLLAAACAICDVARGHKDGEDITLFDITIIAACAYASWYTFVILGVMWLIVYLEKKTTVKHKKK